MLTGVHCASIMMYIANNKYLPRFDWAMITTGNIQRSTSLLPVFPDALSYLFPLLKRYDISLFEPSNELVIWTSHYPSAQILMTMQDLPVGRKIKLLYLKVSAVVPKNIEILQDLGELSLTTWLSFVFIICWKLSVELLRTFFYPSQKTHSSMIRIFDAFFYFSAHDVALSK